MRAVWKFGLTTQVEQTVLMPKGAEILHVDEQGGWLCLWAGVRPELKDDLEPRKIQIVGTGHQRLPDTGVTHLGSVLMQQGAYVWHVFEVSP